MSNTDLRKLPPQSLEAEMSILGGILIDNDAINRVLEMLIPEDFYRESHRKIFQAMMKLSDLREPCDLITMTDMLKKAGELEEIGGAAYLATLVDYVPTAANISYYCKMVKEKSTNRKLISVATEIVSRGYDEQADVEELLDKAQKEIYEISENKSRPQYVPVQAVLKEAFNILKNLHDQKEHAAALKAYSMALELDPNQELAHNAIGLLYHISYGDKDSAMRAAANMRQRDLLAGDGQGGAGDALSGLHRPGRLRPDAHRPFP